MNVWKEEGWPAANPTYSSRLNVVARAKLRPSSRCMRDELLVDQERRAAGGQAEHGVRPFPHDAGDDAGGEEAAARLSG